MNDSGKPRRGSSFFTKRTYNCIDMKPIKSLISADTHRKIDQRRQLSLMVSEVIPFPLKQHISVSELRGSQLHILADSQAWASEFRYHKHEIMSQLSSLGAINITDIKIRVSPPKSDNKPEQQPSRQARAAATNPHIARLREILNRQ
ncbi:MAG TPA: DUF721 domain-containing protein [Gammaproteobacteria bacterium]|nr:DUF721 domain-containing protein [Gammaproteobacteria bacterium]